MNEANTLADVVGPHDFSEALRGVINRHSRERGSDTPDFLLADYLVSCLDAYGAAVKARDKWFSFEPWAPRQVRQDQR